MNKHLILVGGGSRSGKSEFALTLARRLGQRRLFLATAQPGDAEMRARIERHRQTRGPDFDTVEEPLDLPRVLRQHSAYDVVVVDCLTLWLSNLLLQDLRVEVILERVDELLAAFRSGSSHAVVVTNEVGLGIVPESELGRIFRDVAGLVHQRLASVAEEVYFAVLGTVLRIKPTVESVPRAI